MAHAPIKKPVDQGAALILGGVLGMVVAGALAAGIGGWQLWRASDGTTPAYGFEGTITPAGKTFSSGTMYSGTPESNPYYQTNDTETFLPADSEVQGSAVPAATVRSYPDTGAVFNEAHGANAGYATGNVSGSSESEEEASAKK